MPPRLKSFRYVFRNQLSLPCGRRESARRGFLRTRKRELLPQPLSWTFHPPDMRHRGGEPLKLPELSARTADRVLSSSLHRAAVAPDGPHVQGDASVRGGAFLAGSRSGHRHRNPPYPVDERAGLCGACAEVPEEHPGDSGVRTAVTAGESTEDVTLSRRTSSAARPPGGNDSGRAGRLVGCFFCGMPSESPVRITEALSVSPKSGSTERAGAKRRMPI